MLRWSPVLLHKSTPECIITHYKPRHPLYSLSRLSYSLSRTNLSFQSLKPELWESSLKSPPLPASLLLLCPSHLPISLSSDLKSILGFNSFCTQLLFSTWPSSHPIHSLQHTRLILVKQRPEMLKFIWTKYGLQDLFQSGSSLHSPFPAPPTAPHVHLPQGKTSCLIDTPHSLASSLHRSPWSLCSERFLPSHSYPQLPGPFQLTHSD